jgi:hypothetical protein
MSRPEDSFVESPSYGPSAAREAVLERARLLSLRIEYLTWPDRAKELDRFFWADANERLGHHEITAVINRQALKAAEAQAVGGYARQVKEILTGAVALLNEPPVVGSVWQAFTWLLVQREREHAPALLWLRGADPSLLRSHLALLPGFAFLILTVTQDDTLESFLARDAFWDAMLGATRELNAGQDRSP